MKHLFNLAHGWFCLWNLWQTINRVLKWNTYSLLNSRYYILCSKFGVKLKLRFNLEVLKSELRVDYLLIMNDSRQLLKFSLLSHRHQVEYQEIDVVCEHEVGHKVYQEVFFKVISHGFHFNGIESSKTSDYNPYEEMYLRYALFGLFLDRFFVWSLVIHVIISTVLL